MSQSQKGRRAFTTLAFIAGALASVPACAEATASTPQSKSQQASAKTAKQTKNKAATGGTKKKESKMTSTTAPVQDQKPQAPISLPKPKVDLPEVPYDKAQLAGIRKLDEMITVAAEIGAAVKLVDGQFQQLKLASQTSLNGTTADQVRGLLKIIGGFEDFDAQGMRVAAMARKSFMAKFASDDEFSSKYRETYSKAEEELDDVIADNKTRRSVVSVMMNSYRNTPRTNLSYLESMVEDAGQLREKAVDQVIRSAETSMMVADYKKGRALTDLLQATRSTLSLVGKLDAGSEKIAAILTKVAEKEASRKKDIEEARAAYRFPKRYDATNAPKDAAGLEEAMRQDLEKAGHKVESIVIADNWIAVHSALGIHLYNQIDFYVAVQSRIPAEAKAGVLDVLYVTGKTGTTKLAAPFTRRSLGTIGQMLKANL